MEIKSNSVDTFIKFILAGQAASHQLQLFTSKPKSKLNYCCSMQLHITYTTTALAVKLLLIKLQISVHVGIEFYITNGHELECSPETLSKAPPASGG